jgi:hypothetical protein
MKLGIVIQSETCYNIIVEMNRNRGVLLLNAVGSHNKYCGQSAPYQVDSRPAVHLDNDSNLVGGVLFCGLKYE